MTVRRHCWIAALVAALGCSAEGGGARPEREAGTPPQQQDTAVAERAPTGPVDAALAARGEQLFQTKGCIGCHTIGGGRLTGPDLDGVTERRDYGWIVAMVTNPDSMLRADSTARHLFAEYMTPMMTVGVTPEEARAIYEHLRDAGAGR